MDTLRNPLMSEQMSPRELIVVEYGPRRLPCMQLSAYAYLGFKKGKGSHVTHPF